MYKKIWEISRRRHLVSLVFEAKMRKMDFFPMFKFDGRYLWIQWEFRDVLYLILKVYSRPLKWDTVRFCTPTGIGLHVHFKKAILHLKRATVRFYLSMCVWLIANVIHSRVYKVSPKKHKKTLWGLGKRANEIDFSDSKQVTTALRWWMRKTTMSPFQILHMKYSLCSS